MSGYAEAIFTCGAMLPPVCGETIKTQLSSEYYIYFSYPEGWHIDLDRGVVRCPAHCNVVLNSRHVFDHWEDHP